MAEERRFRINAKHFFLTFPHCDLPLSDMRDFFAALGSACGVVAAERHADGSSHRHVYLEFANKRNIKDPRHFDMWGKHPNVQACRSAVDVLKYCIKDEDYLSWGAIDVKVWQRCDVCGRLMSGHFYMTHCVPLHLETTICHLWYSL